MKALLFKYIKGFFGVLGTGDPIAVAFQHLRNYKRQIGVIIYYQNFSHVNTPFSTNMITHFLIIVKK